MSLRIAIPTDFSPQAERAARFILELLQGEPCVFFLVHTYTPSFFRAEYLIHSPGQIGLGDFYKERVMRKLRKFEKALMPYADAEAHEFYTHAAFNNLDAEMNDMAKKEALDLIAMGTQGATGAREVLFGTHAVQVMHKANIPVLVIPASAEAKDIRDVLFPTDYKPDYSKLKMEALLTVLQRSGAHVHILHAYAEGDLQREEGAIKETLASVFSGLPLDYTVSGERGILEAIDAFVSRKKIQLLVMVRNRHTLLEQLLVTPVIDQIGFHTNIPFWVIPSEEDED